jgi:hypothetical protein
MKHFFTYELLWKGRIIRKGKGHCSQKSVSSVERYLEDGYSDWQWDSFRFSWHVSESAALKNETRIIDAYLRVTGSLPPGNQVRGGGGRQVYLRCKSLKLNGEPCPNDALAGNYGFCGVHRC